MITIKNSQRKIIVDIQQLKKNAQYMLNALGYPDFDLGIFLTTNKTIHRYNKQFRHKDKPTDILSFPFHPDIKPGEKIVAEWPEDKNLGDLIISLEYVQKEAIETWNTTLDERMKVLLAHGLAHLLNYDHITDADYAVMQRIEKKLLKAIEAK
jgi:probable rRNA maturation factor